MRGRRRSLGVRSRGSRLEPLETPPPRPPRRGEGDQVERGLSVRRSLPWVAPRDLDIPPPSEQEGGGITSARAGRDRGPPAEPALGPPRPRRAPRGSRSPPSGPAAPRWVGSSG